jgi:hypothetical protein
MSSSSDFELIHGQLHVTKDSSKPEALGRGPATIRGATYMQGPTQVGKDDDYSDVQATLMVGRETNSDTPKNADRSLYVKGDVKIEGDGQTSNALYVTGPTTNVVYIDGDLYVSGKVDCDNKGRLAARFSQADARPKPFDMVHPSLGEGHRLRYACIEGPEVGIYFRGRLKNKNEIEIPWYWKDLVHTESISVQLQPIGAHQDIIIKRWNDKKIYLQAKGGMTIDCFYHVYAERKDVNALITEYKGNEWSDYPDQEYNDPQYKNKVNTKTL